MNGQHVDLASLKREDFRTSTFTGATDDCVHLAPVPGGVVMWESEHPFSPENLTFIPSNSFHAFRKGVQAGEFDDIC